MSMLAPLVDGLRPGQLVEIHGGPVPGTEDTDASVDLTGQLGQLLQLESSGQVSVALLSSGATVRLRPTFVRAAEDLQAPGEGGGPNSFDVVVGPRTNREALGRLVADCLVEKGFCVLRVIEGAQDSRKDVDVLRQRDQDGKLGRLAMEVEEGYLGKGGRAKVMWLDPNDHYFVDEGLVRRSDASMTAVAEVLQPYSEDILGAGITERSAALVCLSMTDADEAEYESPAATDRMIEEFYTTWARSLLRVVRFLGPGTGKASLSVKEKAPLQSIEALYEINACPNTMLIIREDTFEYSFDEPEDGSEAAWLQSFYLKPGPEWTLGDVDGDVSMLGVVGNDGPPPPVEPGLVAIVALSIQACGRMSNHEQEWTAYVAGTDGQLEMPFARFEYLPYYSEETDMPYNTTFVKHFSVQEGIEMFDNRIFEISNMEAECMDPQCRQIMEVGYLAIQRMGHTKKYANTNPTHASVSVGCDKQEWLHMPQAPRSVGTNNQLAITANRFNYVFNLKGGSFVCDTACSSSLVAGHLGKVNLLERRWDPLEWHLGMGVSLTLTVGSFIHGSASHMLSPGGRCFTFNATANGYNRGDGTAGMVMKTGSQDDLRMAYFRGSQIGQDGRSASMSAPNGPAQEKCVWGAIREARMTPPESTVWECHGTGTSLGDPIEVGAVRKVQIKMKRLEPLMVASSKSNFGHLEGSAAALAMNKCVMVVLKIIAASTIHLKTLNPHLDHAAFDAIFVTEMVPYKYNQGHCQVSSFGVGGTNGHAIFWGEGVKPPPDFRRELLKKIMRARVPIMAEGNNPENWEFNGLDYNARPGDKYRILFDRDPISGEETVIYEKELDVEEPVEFYSTTGNHNDWADDRMMEGEVPGLFYQEIPVPDSGVLEFRVLAEGDQDRAIGPMETTSRRTVPIVGPSAELRTSWVVKAEPGTTIKVEFFAPLKEEAGRTMTWFPVR